MTTINTKLHGTLDYTLGALLMLSPWIFNYSRETSVEVWIPVISGAIAIFYTLFTDAEFGVVRKIKLSNHFLLDLILGSFLVASPKLFHYAGYVYLLPYLWIGLFKIFISLAAGNILHSSHIEQPSKALNLNHPFKNFIHHIQHINLSFQKSMNRE
ncbi:MAG: SPW repeat protein [Cytophagaceae bacterium]|nr:SPW repeat protein [Cytophagaceae bacterium]